MGGAMMTGLAHFLKDLILLRSIVVIVFDVETYAPESVKTVGAYKYCRLPGFHIILLTWWDSDTGQYKTWQKGQPIPSDFYKETTYYAFNAAFEYEAMQHDPSWRAIPRENFVDVMALCGRYGFPQSLEDASRVLAPSDSQKEAGKSLITHYCMPGGGGRVGDTGWQEFVHYNVQDVKATVAILRALPSVTLNATETKIFQLNWEINLNGIPVDVPHSQIIYDTVQAYIASARDLLADLTDGYVHTPKQVKRIREWLELKGFPVPNLQAQTVQELLEQDLPEDVQQVLEIRASASQSSIGKYKRVLEMNHEGRMYYNSRYYGAHTGRITGSGFQMLNLPRAKTDEPEEVLRQFDTGEILDGQHQPILMARALVRSIVSAPDGWQFYCADYSSVEYILLVWLAGDQTACHNFELGLDQYKALASKMYNKRVEEITKPERQMGKVGILGCGYGMGAVRCQAYAKTFGMDISHEEAQFIVTGFRKAYPLVRNMWHSFNKSALAAVRNPGVPFQTHQTQFKVVKSKGRVYLQMILPSGRALYYSQPQIVEGMYGEEVGFYGIEQTTHQWTLKSQTPGKWTENVIQAIARDILYHGKLALRAAGYRIVASIYDEVLAEVPDSYGMEKFDEFVRLMCSKPDWAKTLPLKADGWAGKRYRKE